ncbi:MAG: MarR family winged helix-turn-helix transcriptional regulator [Fimbriimonadaceae bacterium]
MDEFKTKDAAAVPTDVRIFRALRVLSHGFEIHSRRLNAQWNITGPQLVTLQAIHEHGPLTARQLSQLTFLSPSTLVGILDRLEAKGWIKRTRDTRDRRSIFLESTESGKEKLASTPSALHEGLVKALQAQEEVETVRLADAMERLVYLMGTGASESGDYFANQEVSFPIMSDPKKEK